MATTATPTTDAVQTDTESELFTPAYQPQPSSRKNTRAYVSRLTAPCDYCLFIIFLPMYVVILYYYIICINLYKLIFIYIIYKKN